VNNVQDALTFIPRPQSVQVEPSDPIKASQEVTVLIEALPPVLIVHLNLPLRHSRGWRSQESQACPVFPGA
jgi:hypothetical protein